LSTAATVSIGYIRLMHEVSLIVKKKFGVVLEPEIRVIGRE
jgi:UDP-N-acetylenolpyruvoylglucosamine reductase